VAPAPYDAARELQAALVNDRLDTWAASLPPPYAGYRALQGAYGRYRKVADEGGWPSLPSTGVSIRPGASDPRIPALRKRLALEGYVVGSGTGNTYDAALVDAVRRFQSRRGLNPDGVIGNGALAELNISARARADQLAANLERWRWIPRALPAHRIEVNLPTAMLDYYRGGTIPSTMKVAVGATKHETPMMTANITSIVLNPPWNVPLSIVKNEIAPRLGRDPGYLRRENLKVVGKYANGLPMLQQAPGPGSALGRVKFDSPNEFAVFLHDTPSKAGFSRADRLLSHGCVRLERPLELARLVLEGTSDWTPERMQAAVDAGKTVRVSLPEPVPMYLFYWTSFVDGEGKIYFWDDIYGWDKRLTAALADAPVQMAAR
jgi:murein L,D-transpeptidase YcbB/YkuD